MNPNELKLLNSLTKSQINDLIHYSNTDPILAKWTSDPIRFKDRAAVATWLQKKPTLTVLTDDSGELLGLIWIEEQDLPQNIKTTLTSEESQKFKTTSGVRLYGRARGMGLGAWFFQKGLDSYGNENYWSRVSADNHASLKVHAKVGFEQVTQPDHNNKVILIRYSTKN